MPRPKKRKAPMQELRQISPRLISQGEYYNPLPEDDYRNDPYFRRGRQAFDAERYSGRAGYGRTAAEKEANIDQRIKDENRSMLLSGRGLEPMMYMVNKYKKGGTVKYQSERANSNRSNSGTTSGIPGVGRPKTTRQGAPDKMKPIGVKSIQTGEMRAAASDKARTIKDLAIRKGVGETVKPAKKKRRLIRRK